MVTFNAVRLVYCNFDCPPQIYSFHKFARILWVPSSNGALFGNDPRVCKVFACPSKPQILLSLFFSESTHMSNPYLASPSFHVHSLHKLHCAHSGAIMMDL